MNRVYVVAMGAIALGLTLEAPLAGADEATTKGDAVQSAPDTQPKSSVPHTRHPPTAQMDRATPPDKSPADRSAATKHPPTAQMDRAAPTERSPGTTDESASPRTNERPSK